MPPSIVHSEPNRPSASPLSRLFASVGIALLLTLALALVGAAMAAAFGISR